MVLGSSGRTNEYMFGSIQAMLSRAVKRLFGFPGQALDKSAMAGGVGVFLHGDGSYPFDVTEVSDLQKELYEFFGEVVQSADELQCIAVLDFDQSNQRSPEKVSVAIEGKIIGSCPSHLGNQCREWLNEWSYSRANVLCRAIVIHRRGIRTSHTDRFVVKLDIAVPFKMTTF